MSAIISRKPAGLPVGGQFASHDRLDGDVDLHVVASHATPELDFSFPFPQANNLQKVACVVDAVAAGADTAVAIAETLDLSDREGAYYGDAAGYLGFVSTISTAAVKTYELTAWGEVLLTSSPAERAELLKATAFTVPAVQIYNDRGEAGALEYLSEETTLGETTMQRRVEAIAAWRNTVARTDEFSRDVEMEHHGAELRREAAAMNAVRERLAREERASGPAEKELVVCESCWMALPMTGVCESC